MVKKAVYLLFCSEFFLLYYLTANLEWGQDWKNTVVQPFSGILSLFIPAPSLVSTQ